MWNAHVQQRLVSTVAECRDCKASSTPPPNHHVAISSTDISFNDVVCLDHFPFENLTIFHVMDVTTRFSAFHVVSWTSIDATVYAFELTWILPFWPLAAVQADGAFQTKSFKPFHSQ